MKSKKSVSVAGYIQQQIAVSGVSQREIATVLGYENANVVSMFKTGRTKLPVNKVGPLAKALGVDPVHLLRLVMNEYMPDTFETIQDLVGNSLITQNEMKLIQIVRKTCGGIDLALNDRAELAAYTAIVEDIVQEQKRIARR